MVELMYRVYDSDLILNEIHFKRVWIDPHYEIKHSGSINDALILSLLTQLHKEELSPISEANGFRYYEVDLERLNKLYRLILVTPDDGSYLGVRNAYRRSK